MGHEHHHHAHTIACDRNMGRNFILGIGLNAGFVILEAAAGLYLGSLALLSDAGHNLSDVFSLLLALFAFRMMQVKPSPKYTYGYKRMTILVALTNALLLLAAVVAILWSSIGKLMHPTAIDGDTVAWVAGAGILVNAFTAWLFFKGKDHDLNVKGAYLHMAADTLVSVGVLIAGVVIQLTGWYIVDPIIGIAVGIAILLSSWGLLRESVVLALDGVPRDLDLQKVRQAVCETPGVCGVHHLHVWALSTTENALTAHVVVADPAKEREIKAAIKRSLAARGVQHATLELELSGECAEEHHDIYRCDRP